MTMSPQRQVAVSIISGGGFTGAVDGAEIMTSYKLRPRIFFVAVGRKCR
jgi:hypothetical protein